MVILDFNADLSKGGMMHENKERSNRSNNRIDRDSTNNDRDIDVDPLADFILYVISHGKLPKRIRIFFYFYGIYWRVKSCLERII